ncbi:Rpn family recombination-promoting nuclease/putative transposase [Nocardia concava]|uniref:Rpn family recombination-promoting nuclease/putative transposase n=1 Tax=Nocardia concava TaxID=257281 RepID=UPI0003104401|nr:Rpn family recombination-promoting nuclease/putative transposase [Nocardia concava]
MAADQNNWHDAYFRRVMDKRENATAELQTVMSKAMAARIEWETLELQQCHFVSSDLRVRLSDLLYRARIDGREAFIYVLIEHQSRPHPLMPFRMLEYMVRIWNRYIAEHPKTDMLPAVIPVVVYVSPEGRRWSKPTELADLIDVDPATREAFGEYLPHLRFLIDDLTAEPLQAILARDQPSEARTMLALLKTAPGNRYLGDVLKLLLPDLDAILAAFDGKEALISVVTYIRGVSEIRESDLESIVGQLGPQAMEVIMTTADRLRAQGRAQGRAEGIEEGIAEGEAKGRIEERAEMLIELLAIKFGTLTDQTVATVRSADPEALRIWSARVLTADSLDQVFQ